MRRTLAAVLAALVLVLAGCGGAEDGASGELAGTAVDPPFQVGAQALTTTDGAPFSLVGDSDARLTLMFFGYTRCPDICPMVMQTITSALTRLDDADRELVDVVFVTTDPARDTGPVLRDYLDRLDPSYIGLTGDLEEVVALAETVGIFVADAEELDSGGYDLGSHGAQVIGVDGTGEAPIFWRQDTSSAQYAADIELLLGDA